MEKIYFVGAGPGDEELISLKGYRLLKRADIVIFAGSLVNPKLLDYCKEDCQIYDSSVLYLEEIIEIMRDGAKKEKIVVRLQTGDVSIYGSIREQAEELKKIGIDYESVAGISSFLGAAASLGIEYTVPEISQSLIITRLEGRTPVPELEKLELLAEHKTSMAIFLSVQNIEKVVEKLLEGAYEENTPIAVVYKATWEDEKIVMGTLNDITQKVKDSEISKTALILVGDFLGDKYNYSKLYSKYFSHEYRDAIDNRNK